MTCSLVSAPAALFQYSVMLDGPSEFPPVASPGTGYALVFFDDTADTMQVQVLFSGLLGTTTASHIHAATIVPFTGTIGVATPLAGFPIGVTIGSYSNTLDLTSSGTFSAGYISANGGTPASAEAALLAAAQQGRAYLNIHTTLFPGGEIRGFLTPVPIPEPSSLAVAAAGIACMAGRAWVRKGRAPKS